MVYGWYVCCSTSNRFSQQIVRLNPSLRSANLRHILPHDSRFVTDCVCLFLGAVFHVTDLFGKKVSEDRIMNYIQQVGEYIRIVLPSLLWAVGVGLLY